MNMNILYNKDNPFTVPDGYFDDLQERVMSNIDAHERAKRVFLTPLRMWFAAAACVLLIFTGGALLYTNKQPVISQTFVDEDFYRWLFASEKATWLAETLDIEVNMPETANELCDEDRAIISFLERDNISVAAIVHSLNNQH